MEKYAYSFGILATCFGFSISSVFGAVSEMRLVSEDIPAIAYRSRGKDAVAREIRHADEGQKPQFKVISAPVPPRLVGYSGRSESHLDAVLVSFSHRNPIRIGPTFGTTTFEGAWQSHVVNVYSLGILISRDLSETVGLELDLGTARSYISYSGTGHMVNQLGSSAAFRLNLVDNSPITPYMSAGFGLNYFSGLNYGPTAPQAAGSYSDWIASGAVSLGVDANVTPRVRVGVRGNYQAPLFHRPFTVDNGVVANPTYEDAALINTGFYRFMGLVSVSL